MRRDRPSLLTYEYDVIRVRQRHKDLDAADALQFSAIRHGLLGTLAGESRPHLVTADGGLAEAAKLEEIPVILVQED